MPRHIQLSELSDANRLVPENFVNVYRVDDQTVVKLCHPLRLAEAHAMRLVREKTSVPVPKVYDAYIDNSTSKSRGVIVMEYVKGDVLADVWDTLSREQRSSIIAQLHHFMNQLRSIKSDFIGSVDNTSCDDPIFSVDFGGFGPYKTEQEFNEGIIRALKLSNDGTWSRHVARLVNSMSSHEIVLTHADFSPRNILVQGDKVVAIIDWEMSGFYPAYWEYVKAMYHPEWKSGWIMDGAVEKILKPYYLEHAVLLHVQAVVW